jgi:enediyne biosynthesis protein E4
MTRRLAWLLLSAALLAGWACGPQPTEEAPPPGEAAPDPELQGPDLFAEVAGPAGLRFTYRNGEETSPHLAILESLGGGAALIDYDGDGLLDVFLPGGGYFDGPGKEQIKGHPCKLFKNLGGWKFKDVTREVGLDGLAGGQPWFYSHAAAVADFDRDGWPDLLVTGWGRVALFKNVPDGKGGRRFVDVSARAGLDKGITWATSAGFADLDGDGWPDLYVCQYVNWNWDNNPKHQYDGQTNDVPPPRSFKGLQHKVYRNNGDGTFTDVSDEAGLDKGGPGGKGLGVLLIDVNLDGKPDVFVANDTVPKFLYVNRSTPGKIRLTEEGHLTGVALDGYGAANGSMGVDAGDPDGSGLPWLWCTNYENELHGLYRNLSRGGRPLFLYATPSSGIAAIGQRYVGWGTGFLDLDHHGWEDLFIANGHAIRYPTGTTRRQKPVLLRNWNGKFKDLTPRGGPYFREAHLSRGAALGDLDNDGKIDLVVSHMNEPVAVLRNVAPAGGRWLGVALRGAGHADVVGARVTLEAGGRKQTRFARGGGSYASAPDPRLVFGLGKADRVERLSVVWPDGKRQEWTGLGLDRYHVLNQGEKEAREFRAKE